MPSGDIARLCAWPCGCATLTGMSAAQVRRPGVCGSCGGRGWKFTGSRRWVVSQLVRGITDKRSRPCAWTARAQDGRRAVMHTPATRPLAQRTSQPRVLGQCRARQRSTGRSAGTADGCPMADEVILCASELATNAALHSYSRRPGGTFTVRGEIRPGVLRADRGRGQRRPVGTSSPDPERGRGLDIIAPWQRSGASTAVTRAGRVGAI